MVSDFGPAATATKRQLLLRFCKFTFEPLALIDQRGNAFLPGIQAAGKTGTLAGDDPYRGYTWFVGFAPADAPTIAVAALVVNEPRWRIKGAYAAREAMRYWLVERPRQLERAAREAERRAREAAQAAADAEAEAG